MTLKRLWRGRKTHGKCNLSHPEVGLLCDQRQHRSMIGEKPDQGRQLGWKAAMPKATMPPIETIHSRNLISRIGSNVEISGV
jgi:hypothetical protein